MKTIYTGGDIVTMESESDRPEAIVAKDGVIAYVGSKQGIADEIALAERGDGDVRFHDLNGKCLLPAFIDSHSHLLTTAQNLSKADLSGARSPEDVKRILLDFKEQNHVEPGAYIQGTGYDHTRFEGQVHPTRELLDQVSEENPIFIQHVSCHMGVANSYALRQAGLTKDIDKPQDLVGRDPVSGELNGYLAETGMMEVYQQAMQVPLDWEKLLLDAQELYLSHGIATVQEGAASPETFGILREFAEAGHLKVDTDVYLMAGADAHQAVLDYPQYVGQYHNHLRIAGYKLVLDGSPQGKTAWLSQPYADGSNGTSWMDAGSVVEGALLAVNDNLQLLVHCNGDAASQQFLDAYEEALGKSENPRKHDLRPVMVHCQTVRKDQLERMKKLGIRPTFFVDHVYQWGDVHYENLGAERADNISPVGWAKEYGLPYTFHQDTPVLPPDMLRTVRIAVERKTRGGRTLGKHHAVSAYEALAALTIQAAAQYGEEAEKGSIAVGKRADFVILDRNPLKVPSEELTDIKVFLP